MPESGGPAAQAGLHYQNSVAAFALTKLLALDVPDPREQVVEVRVEAPDPVNDVVIKFADGHFDFQSVKLRIDRGNRAWKAMWERVAEQVELASFLKDDQLTLVVEASTGASEAVRELGERARTREASELRAGLSRKLDVVLADIGSIVGTELGYEVVRRTKVWHRPKDAIETDVRRWLDEYGPSPSLFSVLRDIAAQGAGRREVFRALSLRNRLLGEHGITLPEPVEWRLDSYRATIKRQAWIEVPGTHIRGPAEKIFVWPRAREYDRTRASSFEDEDPAFIEPYGERHIDLRAFPDDRLDRILVVGGPGYGKSALLMAIGGRLAEGPRVPALVPLARLSSRECTVLEFLTGTVNSDLDVAVNWQSLAEQGLLVALFDGLDEVPGEKRASLMGRVADFSARYPLVRWMLTVRDPAVATGIPEATVLELLPLEPTEVPDGKEGAVADVIEDVLDVARRPAVGVRALGLLGVDQREPHQVLVEAMSRLEISCCVGDVVKSHGSPCCGVHRKVLTSRWADSPHEPGPACSWSGNFATSRYSPHGADSTRLISVTSNVSPRRGQSSVGCRLRNLATVRCPTKGWSGGGSPM